MNAEKMKILNEYVSNGTPIQFTTGDDNWYWFDETDDVNMFAESIGLCIPEDAHYRKVWLELIRKEDFDVEYEVFVKVLKAINYDTKDYLEELYDKVVGIFS